VETLPAAKLYRYTVSKNRANLFLSKLRQISTYFDNFWQRNGKEAIIILHSFSTSPNLRHHTTVLTQMLQIVTQTCNY